jgi:hypothetical protein
MSGFLPGGLHYVTVASRPVDKPHHKASCGQPGLDIRSDYVDHRARAIPETSNLLFIVIAAIVGLLFGAKAILRRLDAGFVLVFFLSQPVGRMLMRREVPHSDCLLALLLAFVVAYYLGKDGSHECDSNERLEQNVGPTSR